MGYFPFATAGSSGSGYPAEPVVSGTPTAGQVLTAETATTATWEASTGNTLTRVEWIVPTPGATHDALANELTAVSTAAGSGTVVLPTTPAAAAGTANAVKQIILGGGNSVTVETQGSDVFSFTGGATSQSLTLAGQGLLAHYDGVSVWTVYADDLPASQIVVLGQDLGNTSALPEVVSTHLSVVTNAAATGTLNLDPTNTRAFVVTQTGNVTTFTLTSGSSYAAGIEYSFDLYLNPVTYTTAWPANVTWAGGGSAPALTASSVNLLVFTTVNQGTTWYASLVDSLNLPLIVADGGTGGAELGAYEVLAGGTTSTGPVQSVSGTGTTGQVLTSQGASALPAWGAGLPLTTEGDLVYENATPAPARLPIGLANQMLGTGPTVTVPEWVPGFGLLATPAGPGYTLVNGTGTIMTFTFPSDGNLHLVFMPAVLHVTSTETGGSITYTYTLPDGTSQSAESLYAASTAAGIHTGGGSFYCEDGSTFSVSQATALTGGAAILFAQMWGY